MGEGGGGWQLVKAMKPETTGDGGDQAADLTDMMSLR